MVRTDHAVTAWLMFTVPPGLENLSSKSGLPDLPRHAINLHLPRDKRRTATELASHIRHLLAGQAYPTRPNA